jgi:hypothetical protein
MPEIIDPFVFRDLCWPDAVMSREQEAIVRSVQHNDETYVPAGNMTGKDWIAGFLALWYFWAHHPVRMITTSVKDEHLDVLWGEIDRFLQSSTFPLLKERGGALVYKHRDIRKVIDNELDKHSYLKGEVAKVGEARAGHHAPHTLLIGDEASGLEDAVYAQGATWAKRMLFIGNPHECQNFFRRGIKAGDVKAESNGHYLSKVIQIKADSSPNVRLGLAQVARGEDPTHEELVPGMLSYREYTKRRQIWNPIMQCVGLDAEFYEGSALLMFPPDWLKHAERATPGGPVTGIGVDTAMGGDNTCFVAVNEHGVVEMLSMKTPDTAVIVGHILAFLLKHNCPAERVCIDVGGGGQVHADLLRAQGYAVRTVGFGESVKPEKKHGLTPLVQRKIDDELRYAYKMRNIQMYHRLSRRLDPSEGHDFAIPPEILNRPRLDGKATLRQQLAVIPIRYDSVGRMWLLPKNETKAGGVEPTLTKLIGCSPDEADALVLALHAMSTGKRASAMKVLF